MNGIYNEKWYSITETTTNSATDRTFLVDTNEITWGKSRIGVVQILRSNGIECGPFIGEHKLMKKTNKPIRHKVCHSWEYKPEIDPTRMLLTIKSIEYV